MRKKVIFLLLMLLLLNVAGCSNENTPFTNKFINDITEFKYINNAGEVTEYVEEKDIELLQKVLRSGEYTEIEEDWASYSFEIISGGKSYDLSYSGGTIIKFEGIIYAVKDGMFSELMKYTDVIMAE